MLKKLLIFYVFLISYAGAMAHSIVPHQHHQSIKEASKNPHQDEHSDHSHGHDQPDSQSHEGNGSLSLLTHTSNIDVDITSGKILMVKKVSTLILADYKEQVVLAFVPLMQVFHPPADFRIWQDFHYQFSALRAPPLFIS